MTTLTFLYKQQIVARVVPCEVERSYNGDGSSRRDFPQMPDNVGIVVGVRFPGVTLKF